MAVAGLIDPTLAGKYPVILGDGLLAGTSDGIFTGIRYNHKPTLSSNDAPTNARLKPSLPGRTDSYDLSFADDDGGYAYSGSRNTNSNQYVLHFDPERKAFILDKIDSTFNMNITKMPGSADAERRRSRYPHLDSQQPPAAAPRRATAKKTAAPQTTTSKSATNKPCQVQAKEPKRKTEKKQPQQQQQAKEVSLSFPEPQKETPPKARKAQSFEEDGEEEDDDDDDGGLLVEYPGGPHTAKQTDFSPAFPPPRRFDDFMDQRDSEADDADGESDDEPDMDFKLPSPVKNQRDGEGLHAAEGMVDEDEDEEGVPVGAQHEGEDGGHDMEDDLEKDMEMAFEDMANTPHGDESEISEED